MKGAPIIFEELCGTTALSTSGMIVGNVTIKLGSLISMGMSFWVAEAKWWYLTTKVCVGMVTTKGNRVTVIIKIV